MTITLRCLFKVRLCSQSLGNTSQQQRDIISAIQKSMLGRILKIATSSSESVLGTKPGFLSFAGFVNVFCPCWRSCLNPVYLESGSLRCPTSCEGKGEVALLVKLTRNPLQSQNLNTKSTLHAGGCWLGEFGIGQ